MSFSCRNVKLSMHVRLYRLSFARIIFCNFSDYLQSSNPSSSSLLYRTDASECELLARRDFVSDMCTMPSPSSASYASVLINSAQTSVIAAVTHLDHWSPITRASSISRLNQRGMCLMVSYLQLAVLLKPCLS
jgi:hypothetical protein